MNINFKTHFPWPGADGKPEPTHFKEQIMNALHPELVSSAFDEHLPDPKPIAYKVLVKDQLDPKLDGVHELVRGKKLHTIRRINNGKHRIREGMALTLYTGQRFKPERLGEATCKSVQLVEMRADPSANGISLLVWVRQVMNEPGYLLDSSQLFKLAENDGLTLHQFVKLFTLDLLTHGPGEFLMVHWTDLRY